MRYETSVIIPIYNTEKYLNHCLISVINQSFKDYEIILVNDGSTDGSKKICETFISKYSNIVYLEQTNQGQSIARNNGLNLARGKYILFVDSDDYIVNNALEELYNAAERYNVDMVVGDLLNEKDRVLSDKTFRHCIAENNAVSIQKYALSAIQNGMYDIIPGIKFVRRDYLINNDLFFLPGCFYEDHEYTMKLFTVGEGRAVKIRFPFYYYRTDNATSTTNIASFKKADDLLSVILSMQDIIVKSDEKKRQVQLYSLGIAYFHFIKLWERLVKKDKLESGKKFKNIVLKFKYSDDALLSMPIVFKRQVDFFLKHQLLYEIKCGTRKILKKVLLGK